MRVDELILPTGKITATWPDIIVAGGTITIREYDANGALVDTSTRFVTQEEADAVAALEAKEVRTTRLRVTATATLRSWANDARAVVPLVSPTTTAEERTAITQHGNILDTMLDRLAIFFDRFADLLDHIIEVDSDRLG